MRLRSVLVTLIAVAGFVAVSPAEAATSSVDIENFDFAPGVVTIDVGDTVKWTNRDSATHTVTSSSGLWNSGGISSGGTFSRTFTNVGTFNYFCQPHPGMTGQVVVRGEATVPLPPNNVQAKPGTALGEVLVTWSPSALDGGSPVTSYRVCRTAPTAACFTATGTSFSDTARPVLETQTYRVSAVNAVGEGPQSASACSKPFPWASQLGC